MSSAAKQKFPVEVLFEFLGLKVGDPLPAFQVGVCLGFGTVLSNFVVGHTLVTGSQWMPWSPDTVAHHLGARLLKIFRLTVTYDKPADTMDLIYKSVGGKIQAANRQRPHPLQLERALSLRARELAAASARRRSATTIYDEVITAYNKREKVRNCKLSPEETACVKLIARETPQTKHLLEVIWGEDKMQHTAVPMNLLASKFLNEEAEVPVSRSANPCWNQLLQVTTDRRYQFLFRCWSRFQHKVQETILKGKIPNLRNFASQYRESEPEITWRMVCTYFGEARPRLLTLVSTPAEVQVWDEQFLRGALDSALADKCRVMDPSFKVDDLSFIRTILQGTMASWTPDKLTEALDSAAAQKLLASFNLLAAEIRQEGLTWSRWLLRKAEHEETELATLTRARERAAQDIENAVQQHAAAHFIMEVPKERSSLSLVMGAALTAFCDAAPKKNPDTCLRLNVVRMDARASVWVGRGFQSRTRYFFFTGAFEVCHSSSPSQPLH